MNKIALYIATPIVALGLATATLMPAHATNTTQATCSVTALGAKNTAGNTDSRFTIKDGVVTATVVISGPADCTQTVTLAAWQAPNADKGQPYDQQKLESSVTKTFGVGTHTISIKLPTCYYQIDLARGASPTGPNGTPIYETGRLLGSLHGGTVTCVVTPPVTPPSTPTPPVTPPQLPKELPSTGADSTVLVTIVLGAVAAGFQYLRQARR